MPLRVPTAGQEDRTAALAELEAARPTLDELSKRVDELNRREFEARAREAGMTEAAFQRNTDVDEALREYPEPLLSAVALGAGIVLAAIVGLALVIVGQPLGAAIVGTVVGTVAGVTVAVVVTGGLAAILSRMARRSLFSMGLFDSALGFLMLALWLLLLVLPATLTVALTLALA